MKRSGIYILIFIISITVILAVIGHIVESNYEFKGPIQKIEYHEPKHIPVITVNGKEYKFVYNNRDEIERMSVGDSVVKLKWQSDIKRIRYNK